MKGHWAERTSALTACALNPRERGGARVFILAAAAEGLRRARARQERRSSAVPGAMEGLGDRRLRRALAFSTGGFDEACRESRVPGVLSQGANPEKLLRGIALTGYDADELTDWEVRVASRRRPARGTTSDVRAPNLRRAVMGRPRSSPSDARGSSRTRAAPRGRPQLRLPRHAVTGKGAGSSLLRDPRRRAMTRAVALGVAGTGCAVTVKLRSGFDDRGLLRENLLAAQAGGASFVTLHPRTRAQGYSGHAAWEDVGFAVDLLSVPVVGNGDVTSAALAARMLRETGCAGVMIGRGAVQDPLVFRRCRAAGDETFAAIDASGYAWEMTVEEEARRFGIFFEGSLTRSSGRLRRDAEGGGRSRPRRIPRGSRLAN